MRDFFTISENACRVPFADLCKRNEEYRTYFVRRTYEASQCIHPQGTKISCFGIVESGILKAVNNTINGVEQCHSYFEAKDLFPEFLYFTGRKNYAYTLIAEKKSTVLWIPVQVLEEMLEKDQGLMYALLLYVWERIAYWIVGLHNLSPVESVLMPGSQLILANMLHVSRSSLNQELKLMQRDGYFKVKGREMYGLDEEKLNALL